MKLKLFKIDQKTVFPWLFENSSNGINVGLTWVLRINKDNIWINNDKNIELLGQNLIDVTLKAGLYIREPEMHCLIFKVTASNLESYFPFIGLFYLYPIVSTYEIEFDGLFGLT